MATAYLSLRRNSLSGREWAGARWVGALQRRAEQESAWRRSRGGKAPVTTTAAVSGIGPPKASLQTLELKESDDSDSQSAR